MTIISASSALADVQYSGWVNGFGSGSISYTLRCADGSVITNTSTTSPGADACSDGSNSISWSWGAFWQWNVRAVDMKTLAGAASDNGHGGSLAGGGTDFDLMGGIQRDAPGYTTEIAVLTVPGSVLPDIPLRVSDLIIHGYISASDVAFHRTYGQGVINDALNENIFLGGGVYGESDVIVYEYCTSLNLQVENYCQSSPNSTGQPASITAEGSSSISDNQFTLFAGPVPNQPGVFYYGNQQINVPFGNGVRCVGGQVNRLSVTFPNGNVAQQDVDLLTGIMPGFVNYQYWYRDPQGGGSGFNLSNGLQAIFQP
ncbi:MAG: hypothetical protein ACI841_005334 [Planctomycetota bacterium]|jgi:hypothetical protein